MVAFQSEIAPNPNKMICLIPKKASLKQFKWTITKIVLSEFYWPVHVGETALFCLTEAPINEASFLGTARLEFKKCFPAKTTWVTLLQKHMGGRGGEQNIYKGNSISSVHFLIWTPVNLRVFFIK